MIARIWHGRTRTDKASGYLEFLKKRAIPDYETSDGNRGVYILHRLDGDEAHFLTLSFWDSIDAIKSFSGPDIARAKYYPEDSQFLLEIEPTVEHYEVSAKGLK
jgi:heme-degrading monooxygenase HmoA